MLDSYVDAYLKYTVFWSCHTEEDRGYKVRIGTYWSNNSLKAPAFPSPIP